MSVTKIVSFSRIKSEESRAQEKAKELDAAKADEIKLKSLQNEQTQLIKRLQRKLLLVSKVR